MSFVRDEKQLLFDAMAWSAPYPTGAPKQFESSKSVFSTLASNPEDRRSLNIINRRNENARIESENHKFAKRLYENRSSVNYQ